MGVWDHEKRRLVDILRNISACFETKQFGGAGIIGIGRMVKISKKKKNVPIS